MTDLLCRNAQGDIVLRGSVWKQKNQITLSVYGYRGIKHKHTELLMRSYHHMDEYGPTTLETMLQNMAHLWAMKYDVSNYVLTRRNANRCELFHPTELTKEN